jgi:hypothetical protein
MPKSSKLYRIKEVSSKTFQDQKGTNRDVPKLFQSKEERTKMFQKQKGTNRGVPKISGAKRNKKVFQSFLGPKKSKWICDKN